MTGAIAAGHPLTAQAGADVLAAGGNAVDACVAAAATAWVAESPLTGPGAGGFLLVHRARDGLDVLLDAFVAVPGQDRGERPRAPLEQVDVPFGAGETTQRFLVGAASCAVPGLVAGLAEAHRRFGSMPWRELLAPAAALARRGVVLTSDQARLHGLLDAILRRERDGERSYGPGRPLAEGQRLRLSELGDTIERLAAGGAETFYRGELASEIAGTVLERGGTLTPADLGSYRVVARRPLRHGYLGYDVAANPPPSSGGILVALALDLLGHVGAGSPGSADAYATLADVSREVARARGPGFARSLRRGGLARRLLSDDYVAGAAARIRSSVRDEAPPEPAALPSTTHVSVVDRFRNAASLSSSTGCGSGVIVPGTGVHLNNMLGEPDLNPSGAALAPGRRLTSMMAPTIVLEHGRPRLVLGSAGSERLRGAVVQVVVNVLAHELSLREAIDRPRVHLDGNALHCEGGIPDDTIAELEDDGYRVVRWPGPGRNLYFGGVAAVAVPRRGPLEAAGDPRRGGSGALVP